MVEEAPQSVSHDYWSKLLLRRSSRRRSLKVAASTGFASAFLVACGGDDTPDPAARSTTAPGVSANGEFGEGGLEPDSSGGLPGAGTQVNNLNTGLLTTPEDTTAAARPGGIYRHYLDSDIPTFDPHVLAFGNAHQVLLNYNRLLRVRPGRFEPSDGAIEGDLAESWELSPDGLALTIRLRSNAGMPGIAPVNGRALDAQDVVFSWEGWMTAGSGRAELVNEVNPSAPVLSVEATDSSTVVVSLDQPVSSILSGLAHQASGSFFILPVEAERREPRANPIGAGPYYLAEYEPSSRILYRRNENHFESNLLFPAGIEMSLIPERSRGIAALKSGDLHHYAVPAAELIGTKREVPEINLYQTGHRDIQVDQFFGFQPGEGTPFRDVRVRQAWSMMLDRDLYLSTVANKAGFEAEGVPVEIAWNTATLSTQYKGWWLDPRGQDFGENARFYQHNVAEANALVAAAGYSEGLTVDAHIIAGTEYGAAYHRHAEALQGMSGHPNGPFRLRIQTHAYNGDWAERVRDSRGYFDGVAYRLTPFPDDPSEQLYALYNTGGSLYYGFDADGTGTPQGEPFTGDPTAQELTNAMRAEFDRESRMDLAHELQRYLAGQQYFITRLGSATGFELAWPIVRNWLVYRTSDHARRMSSYWLDPSLPPGL